MNCPKCKAELEELPFSKNTRLLGSDVVETQSYAFCHNCKFVIYQATMSTGNAEGLEGFTLMDNTKILDGEL